MSGDLHISHCDRDEHEDTKNRHTLYMWTRHYILEYSTYTADPHEYVLGYVGRLSRYVYVLDKVPNIDMNMQYRLYRNIHLNM